MGNKTKLTQTSEYTQIDEDGNESKKITHNTFSAEREPDYVKLYIEDIGRLKNIPKGQNEILLGFIRHMGYKNVIPAFKPIKQLIATEVGCSLETVNKAVKMFKKKGLFIPIARGMYVADPKLFGRGKWEDIKSLRLTIEYDENGGKTLTSSMAEQLKLAFD